MKLFSSKAYIPKFLDYISIQMTLYNWHAVLNLTNKHFFQIIFKYGYKDLLVKQIVDSFPFRHYPVGLAFNSTIKYWILRKNINMLDNNPITNLIIPKYNNVIFNRYHRFPTFSLSRSTQNIEISCMKSENITLGSILPIMMGQITPKSSLQVRITKRPW